MIPINHLLIYRCFYLLVFITACQNNQPSISQYPIQDFLKTTSYKGIFFSPDNRKILVSSNQSGIYNAYSFPVDGTPPTQLTQSTQNSIFIRGYFPNDERFLYSSDQGGNELSHLYVQELDSSVIDLTPGDKVKALFQKWAQDDQTFYVSTNERDSRYFDVYEYSTTDYKRTMIFHNDEGYRFADISYDRKYIALYKTITRNNGNIYLYNISSKKLTLLTQHEGDIAYSPQTFSPDGRSLYFLSDQDSEFKYLLRYDIAKKTQESLLKFDWDISYIHFSKKGKYLIVGINNDGRMELRLYKTTNMQPVDLPKFPRAEINSVRISNSEDKIALYVSAGHMPKDLFYYDFSANPPRQLTRSLNSNINPEDLVNGKIVRFKSFDGLEIPGVLYKPYQATKENKAPAMVWVHGGPGGQSRIGYSALIQYLVNHGYVIYAINNRGSSGYGKTFYQLDDRNHGKGDLKDCIASKKMLINTGYVDPERIGIIGGSYGGYMVLAAMAYHPQEFAIGVDIFGVANWLRTLQSIPPWWESFRKSLETEMGSTQDTSYLKSISPLFHADKISSPLMVLQGANDPRVLKIESDEIVEAVSKNNVPVEYIIFEDEGHGFMKNKNRERGYQAILDFMDKYLKNSPTMISQKSS